MSSWYYYMIEGLETTSDYLSDEKNPELITMMVIIAIDACNDDRDDIMTRLHIHLLCI